MWGLLNAEILVTEPIEIEYRDGHFHVVDRYSEEFVIRRAIPPHVYMANLRRAQAALMAWCAEQRGGKIIPFNHEQSLRMSGS
jgi:hypothetical protein